MNAKSALSDILERYKLTGLIYLADLILLAEMATFSDDSECLLGHYFDDQKQKCVQGRYNSLTLCIGDLTSHIHSVL